MKAPKAPDPWATAQAQAYFQQQAATSQQLMNMTNQITPYGNLTYTKRGTEMVGGQAVPLFTATQTLTPEQQHLLEQTQLADRKTNDIGLRQIDKIDTLLSQPLNLNTAAEAKIAELQRQRLDPQWAQRDQALEQDLINRGVRPGTEAYKTMRDQFANERNDAYNSMYINARGQGVNEAIQERNQPINEITALLNGQQLTNPNWVQTPQVNVPAPDYQGLVMDQYKAKQQAYNASMGGLFGLGGTLLGGIGRIATGRLF